MSSKRVLRINKNSKFIFEAIKEGKKSVETRAASVRYKNISIGDVLIFTCGDKRLEKEVKRVKRFASIHSLLKSVNFKKVMPWVSSVKEVEKSYYKFPGYKEKIKQLGLIAMYLK